MSAQKNAKSRTRPHRAARGAASAERGHDDPSGATAPRTPAPCCEDKARYPDGCAYSNPRSRTSGSSSTP